MSPPTDHRQRQIGLWAYYKGSLLTLHLDHNNQKVDHAGWFRDIGLPDHGEAYDRILRGRMTWDGDQNYFVLAFYDVLYLPNHVYKKLNQTFNPDGARVVEKPVMTGWV